MKKALSGPDQHKAFLRKCWLLIIAVMAFSSLSAQDDSTRFSRINGYGFFYKRMGIDSVLYVPLYESAHTPYRAGAIKYRKSDSSFYKYTGTQWLKVEEGGAATNGIDTVYTMNDTVQVIETADETYFTIINSPYTEVLNDYTIIVGNDTLVITGISTLTAAKLDSTHIYVASGTDPDTLYEYRQGDSVLVGYIPKFTGITTDATLTGNGLASNPLKVDTSLMSTRAWRQKGDDSVAAVLRGVIADTASAIRDDMSSQFTGITLSRDIRDAPVVQDHVTGELKYARQKVDTFVSKKRLDKWYAQSVPANLIWTNLTYAPELHRLVVTSHSNSTNNVMTSDDGGLTWELQTVPNTNNLRGVAWSPELKLFATVASTGTGNRVNTSPDGINWTARSVPEDRFWRQIIWVSELGLFVAVANDNGGVTDKVMTSPDGENWTLQTCPDRRWSDIVWSPEHQLLVACATGGIEGEKIMTSPDGVNWTARPSACDTCNWEGIGYSSDLRMFVAVNFAGGGWGVEGKMIMTSTDGINWSLQNTPEGAERNWLDVDWSPAYGMFVAVSTDNPDGRNMMYSTDGVNWVLSDSFETRRDLRRIKWVDELQAFVAVAFYDGTTPGDSLVFISRPVDHLKQYLNIYGRDTVQTILGKVRFKSNVDVDGIIAADSITQKNPGIANYFLGPGYFGDRGIEGGIYNFFASAALRVYEEHSGAGNSSKTSTLGSFKYLFTNDGASLSNALNFYSSTVPRLRGAATFSNGANFLACNTDDILFSRATDFVANAVVTGPNSPVSAITGRRIRFGATNAGIVTMNGWYAGLGVELQINSANHYIEHFADVLVGKYTRTNNATVGSRYGLYIAPLKQSYVTNAYSIYQPGSTDSNYLAGFTRMPNLTSQTDTASYKPVVTDANGNINKLAYWPASTEVFVTSSSLTLFVGGAYVFTGTSVTWTLPAVNGTSGRIYYIKNRGSGNITLNADSGSNEIYDSAPTNTITITPGNSARLVSDGTYFLVF